MYALGIVNATDVVSNILGLIFHWKYDPSSGSSYFVGSYYLTTKL